MSVNYVDKRNPTASIFFQKGYHLYYNLEQIYFSQLEANMFIVVLTLGISKIGEK